MMWGLDDVGVCIVWSLPHVDTAAQMQVLKPKCHQQPSQLL